MRVASTHATVQRIWTVELRPQPGGPALACPRCTLHGHPVQAASARSAALTHLARHARTDALPGHLRTCQCRARGCQWHPRHRGCAGPVLLALTRDRSGRTWRLADACAACAAATSHTAVVPATLLAPCPPGRARCRPEPPGGPAERTRVREMLTYLAAALPQFTSPGARLLALQCALRSDTHGCVRLPGGLLRGMRLHGRSELWEELEHTRWLRRAAGKYPRMQAQLLDVAVLSQQPGSRARARAAHWALRPTPLATPTGRPAALQLTALTLASHTSGGAGNTDMNVLARLCGHSPHQAAELLDRLTATRTLTIWHHDRDTDEVFWHLPQQHATARASEPRRHSLAVHG